MQDMKSNILDLQFKKEDIEQLAYHTDWKVRMSVANVRLSNSSLAVRQKVAEVGYGLDILMYSCTNCSCTSRIWIR